MLHIIIGSMFSGKTSKLMDDIQRLSKYANKNCLVIKYKNDNRYTSKEEIQTHSNKIYNKDINIDIIQVNLLKEIISIDKYDVIGIDEGQFFNDIRLYVDKWMRNNKTIIVAGLDGTFEQKPFNNIMSIIPLCDSIEKYNAYCMECKGNNIKLAPFTFRTSSEKEIEVIGADDKYKAVCRNCLYELERKKAIII